MWDYPEMLLFTRCKWGNNNTNHCISGTMAVHPSGLLIPQHVNCMASHCLHKVQMKTPSLPTRLLAPVYGSLTLLALLHRLPFHPRCWDVREVGGGARLHAPAAETRLMKRSSGVFCLPREAFCVLSQAQGRERGGGGVRWWRLRRVSEISPTVLCNTKRRIVRCRKVSIKVSRVGQVGRKTRMSWGLQRTNWNGYFSGGWVLRHGPGSISSRYFSTFRQYFGFSDYYAL